METQQVIFLAVFGTVAILAICGILWSMIRK